MIATIVDALAQAGIVEKDIQTRSLNVQRIDCGDRKGQYQASNVINVTVRDVDRASAVITAATAAGANILSGPDLRLADPVKAANSAYTAAYEAAHARAQAYADAAGMTIARVLTVRDAGGTQGNRYLPGAVPVAPPPVAVEQSAANASTVLLMPGQTASTVSVRSISRWCQKPPSNEPRLLKTISSGGDALRPFGSQILHPGCRRPAIPFR